MASIGENIKLLRTAAGLSQNDLARYLNLHPMAISGWERGVHAPDSAMILKLSQYFNVTTDFLLGKEDEMISADGLPTEVAIAFRKIDWAKLSDEDRVVVNAVIRSVTEKYANRKQETEAQTE